MPYEGNPDGKHYWLTPVELMAALKAEFEFDHDACPYPRPADYDGLTAEWGQSTYVNPPFKGPTAWVRKAIEENKKGKRVVFVFPIYKWIHLLLEAGAEVRNLKDVKWCAIEDGKPGKGIGQHIAMFVLEPPQKGGGMIAALYVAKDGPNLNLPGVIPFGLAQDARTYCGPYPVVAHPPCERWGRYWHGGPSALKRRLKGDDGGCFDRALWAVRNFGGVLEHPAFSAAWTYYRLAYPEPTGGWLPAGDGYGAWVCHVHQGHYGHPADKATWLYVMAPRPLPELIWGPSLGKKRIDQGFHSKEERARARCRDRASSANFEGRDDPYPGSLSKGARSNRRAKAAGMKALEYLSKKQRSLTPTQFASKLLEIATGAIDGKEPC